MMLKSMYANCLKPYEGNDSTFKAEWTDKDEKTVNAALRRCFVGKTLEDHRGNKQTMYTLSQIENFFGLPYTSSSKCAMIGNTNTESFIDQENQWNIEYFALTEDNKTILAAWDREENEKLFTL